MTVKVYYTMSNGSLRKMRLHLTENEIPFTVQNIMKDSMSYEQLLEILTYSVDGVEEVLSIRSQEYKALTEQGIDFEEITLSKLHSLIVEYPKLLRSPITVARETTLVGYAENEVTVLNDRKIRREEHLQILSLIRAEENKMLGKLISTKHDREIAV